MNGFGSSLWIMLIFILAFFQLNFFSCCSLNHEGIALLKLRERVVKDPFLALSSWKEVDGEIKPCSWFGVGCVNGHVVSLDLRNLCLEGTLPLELRYLLHIKSIILRNNSFSGTIPEEIKHLKELRLLDLGYNNFTGPFLPEFAHYIPTILLDNNGLFFDSSPEVKEHITLSQEVDENCLTCSMRSLPFTRHNVWGKDAAHLRILLEVGGASLDFRPPFDFPPPPRSVEIDPSDQPPELQPPPPAPPPPPPPSPPPPTSDDLSPPPTSSTPPAPHVNKHNNSKTTLAAVLGSVVGFIFLGLVIGAIYLWKSKKIVKVTGLSGQLQKAFITGIPNLKRAELITACEDFSNVIGSSSIGTVYKGTLSSGVEIAVIPLAVTSAKDWSQHLERQFRRKIETLSKVNHKNFVNLIGYCEEKSPFTRMMIFEYAPNGTLFEHLHVREAEHLDWGMRLRVTMGMAYCLEHMHKLVPPITHPNLNSSAVNLSDDYAAKLSDFCLWDQVSGAQPQPTLSNSLMPSSSSPGSNVYSFGLVLMEMITGRVPISSEKNSLEDWVLDYLKGEQPLEEMVDPMLRFYNPGQLERISEVMRKCLQFDPQQRPTMRDVAYKLREITEIDRDKAAPRLSPLWWEELEVLSVS